MTKNYEAEATAADEREYLASAMASADVEVGPGGPKSAIAIRLGAADVERLKARADREGVGFTQLARQWILERLDQPSEIPAEAEAALQVVRHYLVKTWTVNLMHVPAEAVAAREPPTESAASERGTKAVDVHPAPRDAGKGTTR
jgi:hypothetical protein